MGKVYRIGDEPPKDQQYTGNPVVWAAVGGSAVMIVVAVVTCVAVPRLRTATAVKHVASPPPTVTQQPAQPTPGQPVMVPGGPGTIPQLGYSHTTGSAPVRGYVPSGSTTQTQAGAYVPATNSQVGFGQPFGGTPTTAIYPQPAPNQQPTNTFTPPAPVATSGPTVSAPSAPEIAARVKQSVVLVAVEEPYGDFAVGTGFVIAPGRVATCAHVVENAQRVWVKTASGQVLQVAVGPTDRINDVAVLSVSGSLPPPLRLASLAEARELDDIAVTGFGNVLTLSNLGISTVSTTTGGHISGRRTRQRLGGVAEILQIDAAINPGDSGGPVYSVRDGRVYGVASSTLRDAQAINFASSVDALRRIAGI